MGEPGRNYLRAKIKIGNAKGPTSFAPNQTVFHHDEVSEEKRKRVMDVKQFSNPNQAGAYNREWNKSTVAPGKLVDRRTTENFVRDRAVHQYNYRAEVLPPRNPVPEEKESKFKVTLRKPDRNTGPQTVTLKRTEELPINPNLEGDFSTGWNLSSSINKQAFDRSFDGLNSASKQNTVKKTKKFVDEEKYVSPMQRAKMIQDEVRRQKAEGTFNTKKQVFQQSEEPVNRRALVNRAAIEPSLKFTTTKHTGVWEYNKAEGRHMWSDTGSFEYASRGDAVQVHDPDKYNYAKPNLTATRDR